jgi:ubiquinone/menaquinone biosynthesis C-methylase UbiE
MGRFATVGAEGWEGLAAWYDERMGDRGDLWHRALIDPPLLRLVGPVEGLRVLDLACGNGYLARRFARQGAQVVGVDASAPVLARARAREQRDRQGVTYHVADAAHLDVLEADSFDLVVCNMALMDIADAEGALRECGRLLRPRGALVASVIHPCFEVPGASAWVVERMDFRTTVWRKVRRYREVFADRIPWRTGSEEEFRYTPAFHRPLSWYFRALKAAGFVVTDFEEAAPTPEFRENSPQGDWIAEIPVHFVVRALQLVPE